MKNMSRRTFIRNACVTAASLSAFPLGLSTAGCSGPGGESILRKREILASITAAENKTELPNIIIILADDLGYGDLSCYGSEAVRTPNIDRMAREGIRFTSAYSSGPICSPSRAGLLTGRYPVRSGMNDALINDRKFLGFGHRVLGYTEYPGIPQDEILLPELLGKRGYATGIIGKWHLGNREPYLPNDFGFDYFYGPVWSNDIKPFAIYQNREVAVRAPADQTKLTGAYTEEAVRFMRKNRDRPFLLYLAHTFPHIPLHASEKFRDTSKGGRYGDTVEELDWSTGVILDELKKLGIDQNTLVIFTSDNGPWYQGSPGGMRGRKRFVFEGGFRVPMIARCPGRIPAGRVSDEMTMNFDIFATACRLAGVTPPKDRIIDGKDILPLLKGNGKSPHDTLYFYWRDNLWAIRDGKWKYHRRHEVEDVNVNPWPSNTSKGPYLFNLGSDPDESYSMIEKYHGVAKKLSAMMDRMDKQVGRNQRGWK